MPRAWCPIQPERKIDKPIRAEMPVAVKARLPDELLAPVPLAVSAFVAPRGAALACLDQAGLDALKSFVEAERAREAGLRAWDGAPVER